MKKISFTIILDFVKKNYLYVLIFVGVILLAVSFIPKKSTTKAVSSKIYTSEQYITDTEQKLKGIICEMLGTKDVSVMITLNNSVENIFADSTKINTDITENSGGGDSKTEQSDSKENQYIIITDEKGNEQALVVTQVMPQIRGVVVVCANGNNTVIKEMVRSAVVTVLDISSKKVCVTGTLNWIY